MTSCSTPQRPVSPGRGCRQRAADRIGDVDRRLVGLVALVVGESGTAV